jgi:hypothetical protein
LLLVLLLLLQEDCLPDYSAVLFLAFIEIYRTGGIYGDLTLLHTAPLPEVLPDLLMLAFDILEVLNTNIPTIIMHWRNK